MSRGTSLYQPKFHIIHRWLVFFLAAALTSCGAPASPVVAAVNPCILEAPGMNPFEVTPIGVIPTIYGYIGAATPDPYNAIPTPDVTQRTKEARHAALIRLEQEVQRWTTDVTIPLDATSKTQILVTFLSPELIQAVYLNNLLKHNVTTTDIQAGIQAALNQFASREQFIFLVTVIATSQNSTTSTPHSMDINLSQMILMNAENLAIPPSHDDHNLDQPIDLTHDPVFGFVYYPLAVTNNGTCNQVLDPIYNSKINIQTESVRIDSTNTGPLTWTIPYSPLLNVGTFHYTPTYTVPENLEEIHSSMNLPPIRQEDSNFWRDYARFVWGQLTLEDY